MIAGCGIGGTAASGILTKGPFRMVLDQQGRQQQELLFGPWILVVAALVLAVRPAARRPWDARTMLKATWPWAGRTRSCWKTRRPTGPTVRRLRKSYPIDGNCSASFARRKSPPRFRTPRFASRITGGSSAGLFELYAKLRFMDLAWTHLNQAKNALDTRKPLDKAEAREIEQFRAEYDQLAKMWAPELKRREDGFKLASAGQKDVAERFKLALFDWRTAILWAATNRCRAVWCNSPWRSWRTSRLTLSRMTRASSATWRSGNFICC